MIRGRRLFAVQGLLAAALLGAGVSLAGCEDGSGGSLVIVNGSGGTTPTNNPPTNNPPATGFTVVVADPAGGTILESSDGSTRKIAGAFTDDVTLAAQYSWILDAPTFIGTNDASDNATITIEAGTVIQGRGGTPPAMLVIRRGSKIEAVGTAADPIVFTSNQPVGSRAPGDWGGLIINGRAPVNNAGAGGTLPLGEGNSGQYGGVPGDPNDDSGTLRYVRIEFAGRIFTSDDELNGIAFQGVGRGTEVDFVQVHRNADDGVEFFGGTVDVRHLLITGALDDSIDWTFGWTGRVQFAVAQQWDGGADCGIEADNSEADNDALPRSAPRISNLTLIGPATPTPTSSGAKLRRGTGANILNSIVMEANGAGLDIDDTATWNNAYSDAPTYTVLSGALTVENTVFFQNGAGGTTHFTSDAADPQTESAFNGQQSPGNQVSVDPELGAATNQSAPNFRPSSTGPAGTPATWVDPADAFFTVVDFIGGVSPVQADDWTAGWTTSAED